MAAEEPDNAPAAIEASRRQTLWDSLEDLGASRRAASFHHRYEPEPEIQRDLELYISNLILWLRTILEELDFPEPALENIVRFYGHSDFPSEELDLFPDYPGSDSYPEVD